MRAIVATFADARRAEALLDRLRRTMGIPENSTSIGTVAAYEEPHDGHCVVAAWVPEDCESEACRWVGEAGGILHPQPTMTTGWDVPAAVSRDAGRDVDWHPATSGTGGAGD